MPDFLSKRLAGAGRPAGHCQVEECLILQYHRVALLSHDPLGLAVQPCNFESQMEYVATSFNVISMAQLKQHLETATPFPGPTVVVTIDGGYSDVLYTAKEVLDRFEIPATVFVPSAGLIERTPFWWDRLEDILIAGDPGGSMTVEMDGEVRDWPLATAYERFRAFDELYAILSCKRPAQQAQIVAEISRSLGSPCGDLDGHATLSLDELPKLEEGGLITVGGHTHHCVKLSVLPEWEQFDEIERNQRILEEVLGHRIEYFAYPFGNEDSLTVRTRRMLKSLGFTLSCHALPETVSVTQVAGPYELHRLRVRDWNPFTFYRSLKAFFD
jgi:peptidoglycan/xylan/chitin deacetylase (PgdA/CDA1 family)